MTKVDIEKILHVVALADNEYDSNGEGPANITDGLYAISKALYSIAEALELRNHHSS